MGRAEDVAKLTGLLDDYRLVTVTGAGGVGKTRLAAEVARQAEDRFPDGAWLVELGAVADPAHVPTEVMSALGVSLRPGRPPLEALAEALAQRRLLLVLDNCEHVLSAVADLCRVLLARADEVRVLATSREQLGLGGETRYRLAPLDLPGSGEPEAARVEALGLAGLADRIDDALRLLTVKGQPAAGRHRSLIAVADWSYRLLTGPEQRAFRRLAAFPGPFTLEAAEAVAGSDASPAVLRLVDCCLLVPPRLGADRRTRYTMLQTLRDYALTRLREAGEEHQAIAALAAHAWSVAEQTTAELEADADRELDALRWLDAEDATLSLALSWALEHDPDGALRLAAALAPWLRRRGRLAEAHEWLRTAVVRSSLADQARAQLWLGHVLSSSTDLAGAIDCYTTAIDAYRNRPPSHDLVTALAAWAVVRLNLGEDPATVDDGGRALALARELGDPASERHALTALSLIAYYASDAAGGADQTQVRDWAGQAKELLPSGGPAYQGRWCHYILATVLTETRALDDARRVSAAGLILTRQADDLVNLVGLLFTMAILERLAGNLAEAKAHLAEGTGIAARNGDHVNLTNLIEECGSLCAETGRWADAVTLWAAHAADRKRRGLAKGTDNRSRVEYLRRIEGVLEPGQLRGAQERGARMPVSAAAELVIIITTAAEEESPAPGPGNLLSPRERELVILVAQGHTNADIAARLYISVRTVASHLDRIRDKTGYRRRADLTRLAIARANVGSACRARSANRATASDSLIAAGSADAGSASGASRYRASPATQSCSRLVASMQMSSAAFSRLPHSRAAAGRTCSQLSSTSSSRRVASASASTVSDDRPCACWIPRAAATSSGTRDASPTAPRPTK